jgi:hypothetical protein
VSRFFLCWTSFMTCHRSLSLSLFLCLSYYTILVHGCMRSRSRENDVSWELDVCVTDRLCTKSIVEAKVTLFIETMTMCMWHIANWISNAKFKWTSIDRSARSNNTFFSFIEITLTIAEQQNTSIHPLAFIFLFFSSSLNVVVKNP